MSNVAWASVVSWVPFGLVESGRVMVPGFRLVSACREIPADYFKYLLTIWNIAVIYVCRANEARNNNEREGLDHEQGTASL